MHAREPCSGDVASCGGLLSQPLGRRCPAASCRCCPATHATRDDSCKPAPRQRITACVNPFRDTARAVTAARAWRREVGQHAQEAKRSVGAGCSGGPCGLDCGSRLRSLPFPKRVTGMRPALAAPR